MRERRLTQMNKKYMEPEMEIATFEVEDIMTESQPGDEIMDPEED